MNLYPWFLIIRFWTYGIIRESNTWRIASTKDFSCHLSTWRGDPLWELIWVLKSSCLSSWMMLNDFFTMGACMHLFLKCIAYCWMRAQNQVCMSLEWNGSQISMFQLMNSFGWNYVKTACQLLSMPDLLTMIFYINYTLPQRNHIHSNLTCQKCASDVILKLVLFALYLAVYESFFFGMI